MSSGSSFVSSSEQFPVGMRVLVVDDDVTCLKILEHMLQRCRYRGEFDRLVNLIFLGEKLVFFGYIYEIMYLIE